MTLGEKRREFSYMLAQLIVWCVEQGYQVQIEEVKRSRAEAQANAASGAGIANSLHLDGLAGDLSILTKTGVLLASVDDYRPIGEKWKSMHPENAWGGDFHTRPDADHFSRSNNGIR